MEACLLNQSVENQLGILCPFSLFCSKKGDYRGVSAATPRFLKPMYF
ncbi:MAG TPA: hypothetical protein PKZ34_04420 [Thermotogota bacterium]|nr:hypothetical protein [Thermotogota bacterium]